MIQIESVKMRTFLKTVLHIHVVKDNSVVFKFSIVYRFTVQSYSKYFVINSYAIEQTPILIPAACNSNFNLLRDYVTHMLHDCLMLYHYDIITIFLKFIVILLLSNNKGIVPNFMT